MVIISDVSQVLQNMKLKFKDEMKDYIISINIVKTEVVRINGREIMEAITKEGKVRQVDYIHLYIWGAY